MLESSAFVKWLCVNQRGGMMARMARAEVFAPDEVAIVHVMNRVVRRCFLLGNDPYTGKNFDHRKVWIEQYLQQFAASFGIDLLGFAIMSNHFHLILRSRPDVVATWGDADVARRWLMLCPVRKDEERNAEEPNEFEINSICVDPEKLATIRLRLSDIGWWMRLLCQHIAVRANKEDKEVGKFWQSRFRAVRLLDEAALLACAAYVDLNPIRAKVARTLESSDHTSVQRRIEALPTHANSSRASAETPKAAVVKDRLKPDRKSTGATQEPFLSDRFLCPLTLDERSRGKSGPRACKSGHRCSEKGFLAMSVVDYVSLLDWTARQIARGKRGATAREIPPVFQRLGFEPSVWCKLVLEFGERFRTVAGRPPTVDATRSRLNQRRFNVGRETRALLAPVS